MSTVTSTSGTSTSGASAPVAGSVKDQTDRFLKILLTQLQNQNPLDPMKPEQFASQLAQFSSLEQQVSMNTKLDKLISAASPSNVAPLAYLGTVVDYDSATAPVQGEQAAWTYSTAGATNVTLTIKDAAGLTVYTGAGDTAAGAHTLVLNSLAGVPDGTPLSITVAATDAAGKVVLPTITSRATITAVNTANGASTLEAAGYMITPDLVKRIATPVTSAS